MLGGCSLSKKSVKDFFDKLQSKDMRLHVLALAEKALFGGRGGGVSPAATAGCGNSKHTFWPATGKPARMRPSESREPNRKKRREKP